MNHNMFYRFYFVLLVGFTPYTADGSNASSSLDEIFLVQQYKSETLVWKLTFSTEPVTSCYLPGNVFRGRSTDTGSGKVVPIGYTFEDSTLVIETYPGRCDGGAQAELKKIDGKWQGDLLSRSIAGFRNIGGLIER